MSMISTLVVFVAGLGVTVAAKPIWLRVAGGVVVALCLAGVVRNHPARAQFAEERRRANEFCDREGQTYRRWVDIHQPHFNGRLSMEWLEDIARLTRALGTTSLFCMASYDGCIEPQLNITVSRLGTNVEDLRDDFEVIGRALQNRTSCAAEAQ